MICFSIYHLQYETKAPMNKVCGPEKSNGIEIFAGFRQINGTIRMEMQMNNIGSPADIQGLAIQLNKNSFGLSPATQQVVCQPPIPAGSSGTAAIELVVTPNMLAPVQAGQPASPQIQVAIKNMATGNCLLLCCQFQSGGSLYCRRYDGTIDLYRGMEID